MCSCEFNFTCARHREPNPDLPDGDDPYNDQPEPAVVSPEQQEGPNERG